MPKSRSESMVHTYIQLYGNKNVTKDINYIAMENLNSGRLKNSITVDKEGSPHWTRTPEGEVLTYSEWIPLSDDDRKLCVPFDPLSSKEDLQHEIFDLHKEIIRLKNLIPSQ